MSEVLPAVERAFKLQAQGKVNMPAKLYLNLPQYGGDFRAMPTCINVPLSKGAIKPEDIYGTLGEVVAGLKKRRESDKEIITFNSTGLAIQDIVCAKLVCEKARQGEIPAFELI